MIRFVITILLTLVLSACSTNTGSIKKEIKQPHIKKSAENSNCYDFGFSWGVCAAKNTEDRSCIPGKDAAIPENCIDDPKTQDGIKAGIKSIQKGVRQ